MEEVDEGIAVIIVDAISGPSSAGRGGGEGFDSGPGGAGICAPIGPNPLRLNENWRVRKKSGQGRKKTRIQGKRCHLESLEGSREGGEG